MPAIQTESNAENVKHLSFKDCVIILNMKHDESSKAVIVLTEETKSFVQLCVPTSRHIEP